MKLNRKEILDYLDAPSPAELFARADEVRKCACGDTVYLRGIIEFSNHCARNCLYCGLRRDHTGLHRYRMPPSEIAEGASDIYRQGIQTVVLQSGDDLGFSCEAMGSIIAEIKRRHPGMAITLSLGERPVGDYRRFRECGADRYLMRHETANPALYERLHPGQSLSERIRLLQVLRGLDFQVGAGFMVGLPGQTDDDLASDLLFLAEFQPDMAGIGPFIPQQNTPLAGNSPGTAEKTLRALALARIVTGNAHLPATTALATVDSEDGLSLGLKAGADVIMTNHTPEAYRADYQIYDRKTRVTLEKAQTACRQAGRTLSGERGDSLKTVGTKMVRGANKGAPDSDTNADD